jgi:hypothetical protein
MRQSSQTVVRRSTAHSQLNSFAPSYLVQNQFCDLWYLHLSLNSEGHKDVLAYYEYYFVVTL